MQDECPSPDEIYDRLFVTEEEGGPIATHFEHCTVCQSAMDGYGDDKQLRSIVADFRDNRSDFEDDHVDADTVARLANFTLTEVNRQSSKQTPEKYRSTKRPERKPKEAGVPFGPYAIESVLGSGGMATVYFGQHELLERPTAIKIPRPDGCRIRVLSNGSRPKSLR